MRKPNGQGSLLLADRACPKMLAQGLWGRLAGGWSNGPQDQRLAEKAYASGQKTCVSATTCTQHKCSQESTHYTPRLVHNLYTGQQSVDFCLSLSAPDLWQARPLRVSFSSAANAAYHTFPKGFALTVEPYEHYVIFLYPCFLVNKRRLVIPPTSYSPRGEMT